MGFFFNNSEPETPKLNQAEQVALGLKFMGMFSKASAISMDDLKMFYGKNAKGEYSQKHWDLFLENIGFSADVVGGTKANAAIVQLSKAPKGKIPSKYSWTAAFTEQGHTVTFEDFTKAIIETAKQTTAQVATTTAVIGSGILIYKLIGVVAGLLAMYAAFKKK